jgi:hypothetical protein
MHYSNPHLSSFIGSSPGSSKAGLLPPLLPACAQAVIDARIADGHGMPGYVTLTLEHTFA